MYDHPSFPPPVSLSRSCLAPCASKLLTTSVSPFEAAHQRGVTTSSSPSSSIHVTALLGLAPLLRSESAALEFPTKHARNSGVAYRGGAGGADSPLWNWNYHYHYQVYMLSRLVCSLFHLFASLGRDLPISGDGAPLLRSAFPPSLHSPWTQSHRAASHPGVALHLHINFISRLLIIIIIIIYLFWLILNM